jgi:hypothetical protein
MFLNGSSNGYILLCFPLNDHPPISSSSSHGHRRSSHGHVDRHQVGRGRVWCGKDQVWLTFTGGSESGVGVGRVTSSPLRTKTEVPALSFSMRVYVDLCFIIFKLGFRFCIYIAMFAFK